MLKSDIEGLTVKLLSMSDSCLNSFSDIGIESNDDSANRLQKRARCNVDGKFFLHF